jgi:hypothetical protein
MKTLEMIAALQVSATAKAAGAVALAAATGH